MDRMLFQKKGAPPSDQGPPSAGPSGSPAIHISIGHKPGGDAGGADAGPGADAQGAPAVCPHCGCVFDPMTGDVLDDQQYANDGDAPAPADATGDAPPSDEDDTP